MDANSGGRKHRVAETKRNWLTPIRNTIQYKLPSGAILVVVDGPLAVAACSVHSTVEN